MNHMTNIGSFVKPLIAGGGTATAGGTGDNTKVTGQTIDRQNYLSGVLAVCYRATLAEDATLSFAVEVQESADGSNWDTAVALQAATVADTGEAGGSTEYGVVEFTELLKPRKRYVRYNVTPDLSAANTDTAAWAAALIAGGSAALPI